MKNLWCCGRTYAPLCWADVIGHRIDALGVRVGLLRCEHCSFRLCRWICDLHEKLIWQTVGDPR